MSTNDVVFLLVVALPIAGGAFAYWKDRTDPVNVAARARQAKRDALVVEYLGYGFDGYEAARMADAKLAADAKAAKKSVDDTLESK